MKRLLIGAFLLFARQALAQTPADDALMRWEGAINVTRTDRLLALAPTIMPDCDISATKEDIAEFYVFWRFVVQEEIDERKALGQPIVDPHEEERRLQMKQFGQTFLRQYQLPELAHVGPEMPHADEAVSHQIRIWKALHCVVEKYGASKFFTINGDSKMGMNWPYGTILNAFGHDFIPVDPEKTKAYMLPNMMDIEPLDALGRFFREAEAKVGLGLADEAERYFFQRYESNYFYDMTDVAKARAWFHTPPWSPGAPHLERPTRPAPPTMKDVLAMCESQQASDQKGCSLAIHAIASTAYDAAGGPGTDVKLCLPDPTARLEVWQEKVVEWTQKHPEKQSLSVGEALYSFIVDSFRCP